MKTDQQNQVIEAKLLISIDNKWTPRDFKVLLNIIDSIGQIISWEYRISRSSKFETPQYDYLFSRDEKLDKVYINRIEFASPGFLEIAASLTPVIGFLTFILTRYLPNQKEKLMLKKIRIELEELDLEIKKKREIQSGLVGSESVKFEPQISSLERKRNMKKNSESRLIRACLQRVNFLRDQMSDVYVKNSERYYKLEDYKNEIELIEELTEQLKVAIQISLFEKITDLHNNIDQENYTPPFKS